MISMKNSYQLWVYFWVLMVLNISVTPLRANQGKSLKSSSIVSHEDLPYIKVKIFPHLKDFAPHRKDIDISNIKIESSTAFTVYENNSLKESQDNILARTKTLRLNAYKLNSSIIIKGSSPIKVVRSSSLPSYSYEGDILIYPMKFKSTNKRYLLVVNELPIEQYLKGVVPSEIIPSWHLEALKSQTVAARTYAIFHVLYTRNVSKNEFFDVDDTISYQVYSGINVQHSSTNEAIKSTEGEILTFDSKVIQAFYHADAGGGTDSAMEVWNQYIPYCLSKKEPFEEKYKWEKTLSLKEISSKLQERAIIAKDESVTNIDVVKRSKQGRVLELQLALSSKRFQTISISALKSSISLDSSKFSIQKFKNQETKFIKFQGQGFGHGVGLSQTGAQRLSTDLNWDYRRVLNHYYTNVSICSLSNNFDRNKSDLNKRCNLDNSSNSIMLITNNYKSASNKVVKINTNNNGMYKNTSDKI